MECLENDREERLTDWQFPPEPRKRSRTTNRLERTLGESRQRTTGIPRFQHEKARPALVFATLIAAAGRWRGGRMTPPILRALEALRADGRAARHAA
jgi:transposase-like protein